MRKEIFKITIFVLLAFFLIVPSVSAEKTVGDLKKELANLKAQKSANESTKNRTQSEINSTNAAISNAHSEVEKAETDIEVAKKKIEDSNDKIAKTKEESAKLLTFFEVMQGEDMLLEYVSGATSMNDLIMRSDAVTQILNYNQSKLKELEQLIEDNKQLQVDLKKKEEDLNKKIEQYESSVASLQNDLSSLVRLSLDIDSQIKAQQDLIKYYESIGCKDDQYLNSCVGIVNNSGWLKPTNKGYISSVFGYRTFNLNGRMVTDYHTGVDIAGVSRGTTIYPTASGQVAAIIWHASCGGNQVIIHTRVNGADYSIHFAHMLEVYVKVGQQVDVNTPVGSVGGGGETLRHNGGWDTCSTGYHLHYNVAKGHYLGNGYSSYSKYVANSMSPPGLPKYGSWYYSRY